MARIGKQYRIEMTAISFIRSLEVLKLIVLPGVAFPKAPCNAAFNLLANVLSESLPSSVGIEIRIVLRLIDSG